MHERVQACKSASPIHAQACAPTHAPQAPTHASIRARAREVMCMREHVRGESTRQCASTVMVSVVMLSHLSGPMVLRQWCKARLTQLWPA
eukprot:6028308-Alexandrium_andersonii.AAC.1